MKKYIQVLLMCFVFMSISYGSLPDVETQHFEKEASVSFYYSLNLKLPQFSANGTYSSFNKIVDSIAEKNKATFFSQAASIAAAPSSKALNRSLSNTLSSQYEVASTRNTISVIIKFEGYNMPAAHPYHNIDTITFDINKKQVISLDKLFKTKKEYLEFISNKARELLQAQKITDSNVLQSGTQPYLNNFINWSITKNRNIRIDFKNYQVGAYVLGEPHIIIDKRELKPLLSTYGRQLLLGEEGYTIK